MRINSKAFTIIELLFVIIIIGILATVALPKFSESYKQSLISKAQSKVSAIRSGLQVYKNKHILQGLPPYPTALDSDNNHLFDQVLPSAITPGTSSGDWQKIGTNQYKYILNDGYIVFRYNNSNGQFSCDPNLSSDSSLCDYF